MNKRNEILKVWHECFPSDSDDWLKMFFDAVYDDEEALVIPSPEEPDSIASSMLLLSYGMTFHGQRTGLAYVYGAGTLNRFRTRGYMSRLMQEAITLASDRGDTFIGLIPASQRLRLYYQKFGFSTVGFSRPCRYTAAHQFRPVSDWVSISSDSQPLSLYADFRRLMGKNPCCVQQTPTQFLTLMDDVKLSGNIFSSVASAETNRIEAMAWAQPDPYSDAINVTEIIASDRDAATATLADIQRQAPGRPITILSQPSDSVIGGNFIPGAMMRVTRADKALDIIARTNERLCLSVRLTDPLLPEQSGTYLLQNGTADRVDFASHIDLDVSPQVLTSMMFSSRAIAEVTGLPASRLRFSLMLS